MANATRAASVTEAVRFRLGNLLTHAGFVSPRVLDEALHRQAQRNVRLGRLLVEMGLLDDIELKLVLALQRDLRSGRAGRVARFLSTRLGSILVGSAAVSETDLERALREQEHAPAPLGEILVRQGAITAAVRDAALAFQRQLPHPLGKRFRLGRMLVEAGVVDPATLKAAISRQRRTGLLLGEILIEAGVITRKVLQAFLRRQRRLIAVAVAGIGLMGSSAPTLADRTFIHLNVTVAQHTSIAARRLPSQVTISPQDVARGYVEVGEPIEVSIRTNNPGGVLLGFALRSPMVRGVELLGLSADVRVIDGGASVIVPKEARGMRVQTVRLQARLTLAPDAVAGTIASPLIPLVAPN